MEVNCLPNLAFYINSGICRHRFYRLISHQTTALSRRHLTGDLGLFAQAQMTDGDLQRAMSYDGSRLHPHTETDSVSDPFRPGKVGPCSVIPSLPVHDAFLKAKIESPNLNYPVWVGEPRARLSRNGSRISEVRSDHVSRGLKQYAMDCKRVAQAKVPRDYSLSRTTIFVDRRAVGHGPGSGRTYQEGV